MTKMTPTQLVIHFTCIKFRSRSYTISLQLGPVDRLLFGALRKQANNEAFV